MDDSQQFDPYYFFLGIPSQEQPPNHYRLLGIELFEANDEIISFAADRQMGYLQQHESGSHGDRVTELLVNVARARISLLDPNRREPYDAQLRSQLEEAEQNSQHTLEEEVRLQIREEIEATLKQEYDSRLQEAIAQQLLASESADKAREKSLRIELQNEFVQKLNAERTVLNSERIVLDAERAELEKSRRDVTAIQQRLQQLRSQPQAPPVEDSGAARAKRRLSGVFTRAGGNSRKVWGIEIGLCSLKALCCEELETGGIVAQDFDFFEYPKLLSQPDAEPGELVQEALAQWVARHDFKPTRISMSVSTQATILRMFKLPPADSKGHAAMVQFEAKQNIPFPLEDVVWDHERIYVGGNGEREAASCEVMLAAMKREAVMRALAPFQMAQIPVEIVQANGLAVNNLLAYDLLADNLSPADYDPDSPPDSVAAVSIGTDVTDFLITDGIRFWLRNIPIGGNHFTKILSRELKLTFAKAEHLKRNVRQAEDPKLVFQTMRPVFNDFVTELQRSITYFQSSDRQANIKQIVLLGNTCKLPGLEKYFAQNLSHDVSVFETPYSFFGEQVLMSPIFEEHRASFGVCLGLCIQALGKAHISTNLLPPELRRGLVNRIKRLAPRSKA